MSFHVSRKLLLSFTCLLAASISNAYEVDPPSTAPSDTIADCTNWAVATKSDSCTSLAAQGYQLSQSDFLKYNPSLANGCHIIIGDSYCIEQNYGIPPVTTTAKPTSTGNGVTTPTPIQTGMTSSCNKFYLVQSGDGCGAIASNYSITLDQFYSWNPAVGNTCAKLIADDYVCVGVIGQSAGPTTTTAGNGISTPQPIQTGMVSNCNKFYLVKSGDGCAAIASNYSITLDQFYSWNPAVGNNCAKLIADDYVCVGTTGQATGSKPTATTTGNGISTPQPIQTGMVSNCNKFYDVVSGDGCSKIAKDYGITVAQLEAWNPAIGSDCTSLWVGDYICVGVVGQTTMMTTTTTKPNNGISTPQPIQTGMVSNCNKFYDVVTGDGCQAIASKYGISLNQFYSWNPAVGSSCANLLAGDYVCVGIVGFTPTTSVPTKTQNNGVSTPTPTQPGIVSNCKTFHLTKKGETCDSIAKSAGITTAKFESWNTGVKSDCSGLWLNTYCCIAIL